MNKYIYTDGSYRQVIDKAIWSITVADYNNIPIEMSCGKVNGMADSNKAELIALLKGLEYASKTNDMYIIRTDYEVGYKFCKGLYNPRRGSKYIEIYKQIYRLLRNTRGRVTVEKVQAAHNVENEIDKDMLNDLVDGITKMAYGMHVIAN